jgi:outer membrane lipoprotein-sorting protein
MSFCRTTNILAILFLIILLLPAFLLTLSSTVMALDVQTLIREVEQQYMGTSSRALTTMQVKTAHWERTLEMEAWSLERDYYLVRILEPAKERDVATLKRSQEVWNYLPKVDRVIKVPPSMMGGSWMGSHITNDDLVKANHIDEEYVLRLLEETDDHYVVECLPKADAAVVWGKIVYRIRKQPQVPLQIDYFDEEMILIREISFDDIQQIGDRIVPMRLTVRPLEKPGEMTILHYRELVYDLPLDETFFSLRNLKQ